MHPNAPRFSATKKAINIAISNSTPIVLDIVPHEFYKYYTDDFWKLVKDIHIVISEVATLRRYISMDEKGTWGDKNEIITDDIAIDTANALMKNYDLHNMILRYGQSGCDNQIVCVNAEIKNIERNLHEKNLNDTRGLGDKLALQALINDFDFLPTGPI